MTLAVKRTFAEMTSHVEAEKNNSDLVNLAQALQYSKAGRQELKKYIEKKELEFAELEAKIAETAARIEAGEYVEYEVVKDIFNKSRSIGPNL